MPATSVPARALLLAAGALAVLAWAEVVHLRSSWRHLGTVEAHDDESGHSDESAHDDGSRRSDEPAHDDEPTHDDGELVDDRVDPDAREIADDAMSGGLEAVVVLGFRQRTERINLVNRYRVRAALRSLDPGARAHVLVLCGGAVAGPAPEAEILAREAYRLGYDGEIRLDTDSLSTWENIERAIPLLEDASTIKVVSNSPHAELGRVYLWRMRPDLAARLRRSAEHRFGELALLKPVSAVLGLRALASAREAPGQLEPGGEPGTDDERGPERHVGTKIRPPGDDGDERDEPTDDDAEDRSERRGGGREVTEPHAGQQEQLDVPEAHPAR